MAGVKRRSPYRKVVTDDVLYGGAPELSGGRAVAAVVRSHGSNLLELTTADGALGLGLLPTRFRKLIWVKRGDYVVVTEAAGAIETAGGGAGRVRFLVDTVLYPDAVRAMQREGTWPAAFVEGVAAGRGGGGGGGGGFGGTAASGAARGLPPGEGEEEEEGDGGEGEEGVAGAGGGGGGDGGGMDADSGAGRMRGGRVEGEGCGDDEDVCGDGGDDDDSEPDYDDGSWRTDRFGNNVRVGHDDGGAATTSAGPAAATSTTANAGAAGAAGHVGRADDGVIAALAGTLATTTL